MKTALVKKFLKEIYSVILNKIKTSAKTQYPTIVVFIHTLKNNVTHISNHSIIRLHHIKSLTWPHLVTGLISDILGNSAVGET